MTETATLEQALGALNQGNLGLAEQLCRSVLGRNQKNDDARNLLGLVWVQAGLLDQAEEQIRSSLKANRQQPLAHNILGTILQRRKDWHGARKAFEDALALAPNFAEAAYKLGLTLIELNEREAAADALNRALKLQPSYPAARYALARLLRDLGEFEEAIRELKRQQSETPESAEVFYHTGVTYRMQKKWDEAIEALEHALRLNPKLFQARFVMAGIARDRGDNEETLRQLQMAIAINPEYGDAHKELNKLLWEMGRKDELLKSYDRALRTVPNSASLRVDTAEFLMRTGDYETAEGKLKIALAKDRLGAASNDAMARCLTKLGRYDEALVHANNAVEASGVADVHLINRAATLMYLDQWDKAIQDLELCNSRPVNNPSMEQLRIAMLAQCYSEVGDPRGRIHNDYERFVKRRPLPVPEGYKTIEDFNRDLLVVLEGLHVLQDQPLDQSLRANGTQTQGHLFDNPNEVIQKLKGALIENFLGYIEELDEDPDHPFLKRKGRKVGFTGGWSVRLRSQGYHASHIHPDGWISSAYYVSLPPEMKDVSNSNRKAGFIHFGRPDLLPGENDPPKFWIEPQEGYQAMFPSYVWHGTEPFESESPRVTVAMDVTTD